MSSKLNCDKISKEILAEINNLRLNPKNYIKELETARTYFYNKEYRNPQADFNFLTEEGVAAVDDAINFLKNVQSQKKLDSDAILSKTVGLLIDEIATTGSMESKKENLKLENRIKTSYNKEGEIGENLSFGCNSGKDVIIQMLIDDGIPSRGHRNNLFSPNFQKIGISTAEHKVYGYCSGIIFFGEVQDKDIVFDKYLIPKEEWPADPLTLQKFVEIQTNSGIKSIVLKYVYKMEEGDDVILTKEFKENL